MSINVVNRRIIYTSALDSGSGGGSTVLFDTAAFASAGGAGLTSQTFAFVGGASITLLLDIGSGPNGTTNRVLLVALYFGGANAGTSSAPAMTWDGVAMTQVGGPYANGTTGDLYFFGLPAPAIGQKTLAVSWTGANQITVAALSVVSADQTGGATTFRNPTSATGTGTANSVTATSAVGDMVMGGFMSGGNYSSEGNTDIGHLNTLNVWAVAANRDAGAASVNLTATAGSGNWVAAGISIKSF